VKIPSVVFIYTVHEAETGHKAVAMQWKAWREPMLVTVNYGKKISVSCTVFQLLCNHCVVCLHEPPSVQGWLQAWRN